MSIKLRLPRPFVRGITALAVLGGASLLALQAAALASRSPEVAAPGAACAATVVIGSSLAVFSGYRFVRRAAERSVPVAILNRGPTRGDPHAQLRIDARIGDALPALAHALT